LVAAARAGDERAWERIVRLYTPDLRRAAGGFRLNGMDVDDVVQVTWLQAYRYLASVRDPESLRPWLGTIARRAALRMVQRGMHELPTDVIDEDATAAGPEAIDAVLLQERADALREAIQRLSSRQQQILLSLLGDENDYGRIEADLDVPVGSIG